jgi:hypothetical protein
MSSFFRVTPSADPNAKYEKVARGVYALKKKPYKPAAMKTHPVAGTFPEEFKIERRMPDDPLAQLPTVPTNPPEFTPGERMTQERWDTIRKQKEEENFLLPEEINLLGHVLKENEQGIAWTLEERGKLKTKYFPPVRIPVVPHIPWVEKNMHIPFALREQIIREIKTRVETGVLEPSNSSYRNRWFVVPKKDGIRVVWNLIPLNKVTIRDAGLPPIVDEIVEGFAGRHIYTYADIMEGYNERELAEESRDYTTIQTPLGTFRLTVLPQGATNSVTIFHGDITFIFHDEIPEKALPFIDDVGVKGPATDYPLPDGTQERIPENAGIRRFVFEHLVDLNRIIHRLKHAGGTFSAKKFGLCVPQIPILGEICNKDGRIADPKRIDKIINWPIPTSVTEARGFWGVMGLIRIFVKNFAARTKPITSLFRKDIEFVWGEEQQEAFKDLKRAATSTEALRPIDYSSERPVILAIDSSTIACGYVLMQENDKGKRTVARYGSIAWNPVEARYSQPKVELYGLMRTLKDMRRFVVGVRKLIIEMDASFIKDMLNNPDEVPNNALNRWIAYAQLFNFELRHVPKEKHKGPDGLSRRPLGPGETASGPDDFNREIDERMEFLHIQEAPHTAEAFTVDQITTLPGTLPVTNQIRISDHKLALVKHYLTHFGFPEHVEPKHRLSTIRFARQFYLENNELLRRTEKGRPQKVILDHQDRYRIINQAHTLYGHRGTYPTRRLLADRFWWPSMTGDIAWFLRTCHECQIRNPNSYKIPPTVPEPAQLFAKCHLDTMFIDGHGGYKGIAHARCSMSGWSEYRILKKETAKPLERFILEDILCRWGSIRILTSDNGSPWLTAIAHICNKYNIKHIPISPYNSQANGIVERQHYTIRETLVKTCKGNMKKWPELLPYVMWADRITTRKATGHSPYYMAHGVEPLLPLDFAESTLLVPSIGSLQSTEDLIANRALQLAKRPEELEEMRQLIYRSRLVSAERFAKRFENIIREWDFKPGDCVLVRNTALETKIGYKSRPRYLGPFYVVARNKGGAYRLSEMDGTISQLRFAAKRLIPYYLRHNDRLAITAGQVKEIISEDDDQIEENEGEEEPELEDG